MPLMHNRGAVSRTLEYIKKGDTLLAKNVRAMMFAFDYDKVAKEPAPRHKGLYNYVFWHLPQLQYKNPEVQMLTFNKMSPIPWIRVYYDDDTLLDIDCDGRSREDIFKHIKTCFNVERKSYASEIIQKAIKENDYLSNFGADCLRHCMCEIPGHKPCPGFVMVPRKYCKHSK